MNGYLAPPKTPLPHIVTLSTLTQLPIQTPYAAACAAIYCANAAGFLVCMNTVPGPENLHTSPSPADKLLMMPPDAMRSSTYLQFQATRWPLSMMYFSPSRSLQKKNLVRGEERKGVGVGWVGMGLRLSG
jgi:hypothetical protein